MLLFGKYTRPKKKRCKANQYQPMPISRNSTELTIPHEHYVVFYPDVDKGGFQCHLSPIFKTGDASLPKKDLMVRLHQAFNQATQHQYGYYYLNQLLPLSLLIWTQTLQRWFRMCQIISTTSPSLRFHPIPRRKALQGYRPIVRLGQGNGSATFMMVNSNLAKMKEELTCNHSHSRYSIR